jgi:hypothetical protein
MTVVSVVFAAGGVWILADAGSVFDVVLGAVCAGFFGCGAVAWGRLVGSPEPGLVIDEGGVGGTSLVPRLAKVPWNRIAGWDVGEAAGVSYVRLQILVPQDFAANLGTYDRLLLRYGEHPLLMPLLRLVGMVVSYGSSPDLRGVAEASVKAVERMDAARVTIQPIGLGVTAEQITDLLDEWV